MKLRLRSLVLVLVLALSQAGCASWWQQLRTDPIAALQEGSRYIGVALQLATAAFNQYANTVGGVPADVTSQFNQISTSVTNGLQLANDGLRIAQHARQPAPDPNALLSDARASMGDLSTFLAGLRQAAASEATPPTVGRRLAAGSPLLAQAIAATREAARPVH